MRQPTPEDLPSIQREYASTISTIILTLGTRARWLVQSLQHLVRAPLTDAELAVGGVPIPAHYHPYLPVELRDNGLRVDPGVWVALLLLIAARKADARALLNVSEDFVFTIYNKSFCIFQNLYCSFRNDCGELTSGTLTNHNLQVDASGRVSCCTRRSEQGLGRYTQRSALVASETTACYKFGRANGTNITICVTPYMGIQGLGSCSNKNTAVKVARDILCGNFFYASIKLTLP